MGNSKLWGYARWLSADPMTGDVSDPRSLNRYGRVVGEGRMKTLWLHRYSILSIGLALSNLAIVFGATAERLLPAPLNPTPKSYSGIVWLAGALALSSAGLGSLALKKERPRFFGILALGLTWLSFIIVGFRLAV